jgi:hypothetical protein
VDGGGVHGVAAEGLRGAGVDGHAAAADGLEHAERVARRVLEAGVAVHGADAEQAQVRAVRGEQDGEGVLVGRQLSGRGSPRLVLRGMGSFAYIVS